MQLDLREVRDILTPQKKGFLVSLPYPFTHTLSPYTGCGFGITACGTFCYARFLPNWTHFNGGANWGELVSVKTNAASVLNRTLKSMQPAERARLRIFMASTTDPYQPIEVKHEITRQCLDVFARYPDLDLLVIQTRSPLAARDFERIRSIPYAWLSVTVETDDPKVTQPLGSGPSFQQRLDLVRQAEIPVQVVVSPCLPYTPEFASRLVSCGARHIVVDDFVAGDGSGGKRTASSPFASMVDYKWRDSQPAYALLETLRGMGVAVGWSAAGFCGIQPRTPALATV